MGGQKIEGEKTKNKTKQKTNKHHIPENERQTGEHENVKFNKAPGMNDRGRH